MPKHHQPVTLLSLCHTQVSTNLVSTCRLLQLIAQDSSAAHALTLARHKFRPNLLLSLPGLIRSQLIEEVSKLLSTPAPDGSGGGAGPAPLYLLALLLAPDVHQLRVELCCYYGCSHQAALLRLLASEGRGLETLELARSALLRLDRSLLHDALISATSLRHLILRNIAGDAVLQVIGTACPCLVVLDVSQSRQVTDTGLRNLFLQVELRDKGSPSSAAGKCEIPDLEQCVNANGGCSGRGWGRLRTLLRLFPRLRLNREGENKMRERSFLLEYCELRNPLCDTLRILNVANTGVTTAGILLALHHVPQIQSLGDYGHMGRALEILDRAWTASTGNSDPPSPPSFSLISARCKRTTMRRLELLSLTCPALQKLTIYEPHHPPSALHVFPPTLTTLHLLSIPSDADWINGLYSFLATPHGSHLHDLALSFSLSEQHISLDLSQILKSCPNLHTLAEDCAEVDWKEFEDDTLSVIPPLINLRSIQLGRVVTAQALTELLKRAPALEIAHFYRCPDLTDEHLINLTSKPSNTSHCYWHWENQNSPAYPHLSQHIECFYIYEASRITATAVVTLLACCENLLRIGNLSNWGLECEGIRWIRSTILDNNLNLEINPGSHWFCSQCFPVS